MLNNRLVGARLPSAQARITFLIAASLFVGAAAGTSRAAFVAAEFNPNTAAGGGDDIGTVIPNFGWSGLQLGQGFTSAGTGILQTISVQANQVNTISPTDQNLVVALHESAGGNIPGTLITSRTFTRAQVPTNFNTLFAVDFSADAIKLFTGQAYVIVLSAAGGTGDNQWDYRWVYRYGDGTPEFPEYAGGGRSRSVNNGATWAEQIPTYYDHVFSVMLDVPEPASVGLAGMGLLALVGRRRRRRA